MYGVRAGRALATGCTVEVTAVDPPYEPLVQHEFLAQRYDAAIARRGRTLIERPPGVVGGSTDMGNVSQVVPSIHPMIGVMGSRSMPHTAEFAMETNTPAADDAIIDGAYGLACAVVDLATEAAARTEVMHLQRERGVGAPRRPAWPVTT